jgi:hypothetical protein
MTHHGWLVGLLPVLLATTVALADEKAACLDAVAKGQKLRSTHKLVEAREQLRVCAAAQCPAVVQSDCANWLAEVEKALPTVVVTAKSGAGTNLVDVKVTADGQPFASKLDGDAIAIDPGAHVLHFEAADGTALDQQVVVSEGERDQRVAVVLGPPASPASPPGTDAGHGSSTWRTLGWVIGAGGVVGLGVGASFGVVAISDKNSAHCNASNQCEPGPLGNARSAALVSNVGLIAGGVLLASGAALVLFAPSGNAGRESTASVKVAPMVGGSSGGLVLGASW